MIGQPAGVAVVVAVVEGGLQLSGRGDDCRIFQTHALGLHKGQGVAVVRCTVVKHDTYKGQSGAEPTWVVTRVSSKQHGHTDICITAAGGHTESLQVQFAI